MGGRVAAFVVGLCAYPSIALAGGTGLQHLHCGVANGTPGSEVAPSVKLVATSQVVGFTFGMAHDARIAELIGIDVGEDLAALRRGDGPELFTVDLSPAGGMGATVSCLITTAPVFGLGNGSYSVAVLHYAIDQSAPPGFSPIEFTGALGDPPVALEATVWVPGDDDDGTGGDGELIALQPHTIDGGIAVTGPDNGRPRLALNQVWAPNAGDNTLTIVDVATLDATTVPVLDELPVAAVLDATGVAWVVFRDSDVVVRFDAGGAPLTTTPVGDAPVAVAVDSKGAAWVANSGSATITKLSPEGVPIHGGDGLSPTLDGDGDLGPAIEVGGSPSSLAIDALDNVFVAVEGAERLEKRNADGELLATVTTGVGSSPFDVAIDREGFAWVTLPGLGRVERRASDATVAEAFELDEGAQPGGIAIRLATEAWTVDEAAGLLYRLRPGGDITSFSATPAPSGIAVDGDGFLWVPDRSEGTLNRFNPAGQLVLSLDLGGAPGFVGDVAGMAQPNVLLTAGDLDADGFSNALEVDLASNPFDATKVPPDDPEFVPPVENLVCDAALDDAILSWALPAGATYGAIEVHRDGALIATLSPDATGYEEPAALALGSYEYEVIAESATAASLGAQCTLTIGQGQVLNTLAIENAGTTANLFAITIHPDAPEGAPRYYLTDPANNVIYATNEALEVLEILPSPFDGIAPTTGIVFDADGAFGAGSLFVAAGPNGDPNQLATVREIALDGTPIGGPIRLYPESVGASSAPGLGADLGPKSGGLTGLCLHNEADILLAIGPDNCELFAISLPEEDEPNGDVEIAATVIAGATAVHPRAGYGLNGVYFPPFTSFGPDGGTVRVTSQAPGGGFEIAEIAISDGKAAIVGDPIPLDGAAEENSFGGFVIWGDTVRVVGLTSSEVYDLQSAFFTRGDATRDAYIDLADAIHFLEVCFGDAPFESCIDAYDVTDDGVLDVSDAVQLLDYLYVSGSPPAQPFPDTATDPTPDGLPCL